MELSDSNIRYLLEKHGFRKIRKTTSGYMACCIFHKDRNPSFSIGSNGLWQCFSCGVSGSWNKLLAKLGEEVENNYYTINSYKISKYTIEEYKQENNKKGKREILLDYKTYKELGSIPEYVKNRINETTA